MADRYTPEEIAEIFEAYNNAIKSNTPVSADLAKQMKDAAVGAKGFAQAQENLFKSLGKSVTEYTKAMYKGEQGAKAFSNSIDVVTDALGVLALIILPLRGISLVTKGVVAGLFAMGKATKMAGEQGDKLYKTYQDLNKAGAATAGGMTEVFNNMQKLGYGIEELDKMTAIIKENAEALSNFGGTVADGTKQFANAASEIQRSEVGKSLQMLGKTPDDINRGVALFVRQQQQAGVSSANINKNLAEQSAAYIKNLDLLSRLTGKDADALQAKLDDAMAEDAFNQTIYELKKKAAMGDVEAGRLATEYENAARRLSGDSLKEFQRGVGGDISAMSKTTLVAADAIGTIGTKAFTASGYIDKVAKGADQFRESMGGLYKYNALGDVAFSAKELSTMQSRYADQTAKQQEEMAKAQQELNQKGLDPATKAATEMRISQMQARDSLQSFVQLGVRPATEALATLARGGAGGAGMLPGGGGKAPMGGGGSGQMDYKKELYGTGAQPAAGAPAGKPGAGLGGKPLSGVSPGLAQALTMAAAEYNQITGKTVDVTSAVRDSAKQAELYQAYVEGRSKFPAARPGTSKHERGLAVDIAQATADEMDRMGLLSKYGLSRPVPNDPVHLEVSAANGAVLSGPMSGYKPNLTMHGTEAIVPLNNPVAQSGFGSGDTSGILSAQLDKLDEIVRVMQNQVNVSNKILQAAN
jgi:hypothetical protein